MKAHIIDRIVLGAVFGAIAWLGLRGILPEVAAAGLLAVVLSGAAIVVAGFAIGSFVYRCTYRCECDQKYCRAT